MNETLPIRWIGYPGLSLRPARGLRPRSRAPGTGTRTRPTSRTATSSATGSSARVAAEPPDRGASSARRSPRRSARTPASSRSSTYPGRRLARDLARRRRRAALGAAPRPARRGSRSSPLAVEFEVIGRGGGGRRRRCRGSSPSSRRAGASAPPGFLMDHVDGTSVAPRVLRRDELAGARERLAGAARRGARRGSTRSTPPGSTSLPALEGDPALAACEFWERAARRDRRAAARRSRPACAGCGSTPRRRPSAWRSSTATSGSATSSSTSDGLAAVIDWELCHAGDPAEDLGWICVRSWRFGNDDLPGRRARRRARSCSTPTRRPAGRGPTPSACAGGRRWETSSGR